ncbi:MAG: hypothetical protein JWM56_441 [Candidatus Peribacteria bacterium]|nr:hypothetical protein [Candidatus Peribacteria bacterium]
MSNSLSRIGFVAKHAHAWAVAGVCLLILAVLLMARGHGATAALVTTDVQPVLSACSGSDILFPQSVDAFDKAALVDENGKLLYTGKLEEWRKKYDENVNKILKTHLEQTAIMCTDLVAEPPSTELRGLAAELPPWQSAKRLETLSEDQMQSVLLEQLRVYQCRLREQIYFRWSTSDAEDLLRKKMISQTDIGTDAIMFAAQQTWVDRELEAAPRALERTLKYVEGMNRLRPLDQSLECLSRTSLDIRNILGLAAETSACLPRIWDARGSLRDLTATVLPVSSK